MIESIDGEKVKVFKGFKIEEGQILLSDGVMVGCEEVQVVVEHSQLRFWIEECGLLEELGIDAVIL